MTTLDAEEKSAAELLGDVVRAVLALARSTARIFGVEARDVLRRVGRRLALLVAASVVAAAGAVVLLGAAAVLLEDAVRIPRWAAFALVGALGLVAGVCGILAALRRLGDADVAFPRTAAELSKDVEALERRGRTP